MRRFAYRCPTCGKIYRYHTRLSSDVMCGDCIVIGVRSYLYPVDIVHRRPLDMRQATLNLGQYGKDYIEKLRFAVIGKGQEIEDMRRPVYVIESKEFKDASYNLRAQVRRDVSAQYKYYEALGMWLGQLAGGLFQEDMKLLIKLANDYITGR